MLKIAENIAYEICKFCINLYYKRENAPHLGRKFTKVTIEHAGSWQSPKMSNSFQCSPNFSSAQ